jgi:hypothetical protein
MPHVVLATTMWSDVRAEAGERREQELRKHYWKDMVAGGCRTERFEDTYESAWRIVDSLAEKGWTHVLLSSEMVDAQLRLLETRAGIALNDELLKMIRQQMGMVRRLRREARQQNNRLAVRQLTERKTAIEEKIRQAAEELRERKIPLAKSVRLFFERRLR